MELLAHLIFENSVKFYIDPVATKEQAISDGPL